MHNEDGGFLFSALAFLAAAVVAVPITKRLGLSPIVGYLLAGVVIGPFGLGVFRDPHRVFTLAEIGIVLLLFVIGLEMQLSRLLALRWTILGLGTAQLVLTGIGIGVLLYYGGYDFDWRAATVAGVALSLSATSIALQLLEQRNGLAQPYGQRAFAVLLYQDMAVVPLLALLPLLAPAATQGGGHTLFEDLGRVALVAAAISVVVLVGRYALTPLFRLLAQSGAREAMTAAALLVVLGAGTLMMEVGMSMALGAFLAGLVLSESSFRHELEANIDAFRGLLLALFFMSVGMSVDLHVVLAHAPRLVAATVLVTLVKAAVMWAVFRANGHDSAEALRSASVLTPAGEFSFVLFPIGLALGLLTQLQTDMLVACAVMTMLLGPPAALICERLADRLEPKRATPEADDFSDAHGAVLVIGFGRFGQIVSQCLLAQGLEVTIIDNDVEMIQSAARFGVRIYYGDGTRLDVVRAAGAEKARVVAVCVDKREAADRIVDMIRAQMPGVRLHVRAYDRTHTLALRAKGVAYEMRETFESAMTFGDATLQAMGLDAATAGAVVADVRTRDLERLARQEVEGIDLISGRPVEPQPLTIPAKTARPLNPEAEDVINHETEFSS
ncbi:MAG TPA: monovalent cation:proton antiporter-2 (CPA2) family protein [Xanthobacteraceae bacterium]|nr:monovalent cation:proton antiporter-2 (CPA2) family protein [Xanthobacteraceae bacterium]